MYTKKILILLTATFLTSSIYADGDLESLNSNVYEAGTLLCCNTCGGDKTKAEAVQVAPKKSKSKKSKSKSKSKKHKKKK